MNRVATIDWSDLIIITNMSGKQSLLGLLAQHTSFKHKELCSKSLPFIDSIGKHHVNGSFSLVKNPVVSRSTSIIGMFVLRPGQRAMTKQTSSISVDELYGNYDWVYNVAGQDGGRLISNNSAVDAFRLALQYGLSDAVIVGSKIVTTDGAVTTDSPGYIWQPYEVCQWLHLKHADPFIGESVKQQRKEWQRMGYLSSREFPAQIMVTWSGEKKYPKYDFLAARIFHEKLPNGKPMETYIVTSEQGAWNIKQRAGQFNLQDRIDSMLITISPPSATSSGTCPVPTQVLNSHHNHMERSELIDLTALPKLLYDEYDIRIANHDGGRDVLRAFALAGALSQLNLTLCMNKSVLNVMDEHKIIKTSSPEAGFQYFFRKDDFAENPKDLRRVKCSSTTQQGGINSSEGVRHSGGYGIPRGLAVVEVTEALCEDVVMVTLTPASSSSSSGGSSNNSSSTSSSSMNSTNNDRKFDFCS